MKKFFNPDVLCILFSVCVLLCVLWNLLPSNSPFRSLLESILFIAYPCFFVILLGFLLQVVWRVWLEEAWLTITANIEFFEKFQKKMKGICSGSRKHKRFSKKPRRRTYRSCHRS